MRDTRRENLLQVRKDMQDSGYPTPFQERLRAILDGDEDSYLTDEEQNQVDEMIGKWNK